ncbi:hypothetical protein, partial [Glaesserella parasuis]|uniref:hypothetical protein n=1 Tax=Glaesserella parasuis TaxID=738 RepID=UPI001BE46F83
MNAKRGVPMIIFGHLLCALCSANTISRKITRLFRSHFEISSRATAYVVHFSTYTPSNSSSRNSSDQ